MFRYFRDSYLLTARTMMQAVEESDLDAPTKQRMRFFMRQYLDAAAPSNYLLTNPEALKAAMESQGETLQEGMKNLLGDLERGRISMTDEAAFEVGRNIAVSKGAVVWENELVQLIQYAPLTAKVHERPLLMVPPCINKFYIMDLQPENSLVRYAAEQGHTVFMVSWRNVHEYQAHLTWDDYIAQRHRRAHRGGARDHEAGEDQRARLLRRRHARRRGARGAREEGRAPGAEPHAAHHAARLHRGGRDPRLHRRELRRAAREGARRRAGWSRAASSRAPSPACAPTTSSGPTW